MLNQFRLIIAEKPSVAQNLAYCVGASERVQDGEKSYFQGNGYIVSNAVGHLFGLGMPEDYGWGKWELETLPVFPEKFRLFPLKGYSVQINLLGRLMKRDDITEIINACDAGREGELIFRYIYEYFKCEKPFKRLWISSLTEESIKNGMANLIDGAEKDNLYLAGQTRAQADFILGMSLSRLYSILNNDVHRVGRVKTPVLNIIANRDEGIEGFVKRPYFKLLMDNGAECEKQYETVLEAAAAQSGLTDKTAVVTLAETKRKTENRPLIHSLTSLQREANDIYGITAADTLKAAQSLYEKKLISYPRSDSNYLSDDMKTLIESTVKCLESYDSQRVGKLLSEGLNIDGRVIDNSRISDHHGIIPTVVIGKLSQAEINADEEKIINLIINRFLSVLDNPYIYDETKYEFTVDGVIFRLTVKKPVQLGWKAYRLSAPESAPETSPYVSYEENDTFAVSELTIKNCETVPPKRFTESSLLAVMENIDRFVKDGELKQFVRERGLGTPATRASIIEELIAAGYIARQKKQLVSTDYGKAFASSLPDMVKSAALTANWEQALTDIENGSGSAENLIAEIKESIIDTITAELSKTNRDTVSRKKEIGVCPRCGSPVAEGRSVFHCTAGKENCGFSIWKSDKRIGRDYTAAEISELLSEGKVTLKNCKSSKGNTYSAVFELEDTGRYVNLKLVSFINNHKKKY